MQYAINMSQVCELAHELTKIELGSNASKNIDNREYTKYEQDIFDKYYNLIINVFSL